MDLSRHDMVILNLWTPRREMTCPRCFVPPVMLVRLARGQGRQARGPQAPADGL